MVGESGCGKTTTGHLIMQLLEKTEGDSIFQGVDLSTLP
ncbi:dipeptide/oligopeptide/nickel ABC transporter ATP-binding protein, partial [Mycobacterium tuberculosis]|nr:dipeptide/oligopeptide/nickel ABC transporter ATP-binding protein [Mycobacterium tuberculosis]